MATTGASEAGKGTAGGSVGRVRWGICALLFFATTINYMDRQILSLLKPILDERGVVPGLGRCELLAQVEGEQAVRLGAGEEERAPVPAAQADELPTLLDLADGLLLTGSPSNVHPSHFDEAVLDEVVPL